MSSGMKYVQIEPLEDIAIVRINRPEALNAMNSDVIAELSRAIEIVGVDEGIKVVIITGNGEKAFCAGADIAFMVNIDPIKAEKYASAAQSVLNKIEKMEKPVIAAINGYALGGGCELALVCDIRIAVNTAKIGQPEVTIGIPPGWGGTQRLVRIVGPAKAKELIFTGSMITAEEAHEIGLVNKVVKLEDLTSGSAAQVNSGRDQTSSSSDKSKTSSEVAKTLNKKLIEDCILFAKEITKNSINAVKTSKMLINKGMDVDIDAGLRLEIYGWALCFAHADRQKMMSDFLNKGRK
ncbi:MAG TPA: enoyl-CoA hydratase-related protein [Nitrososphaeraceae archaeon]